ncbi:hypothetical protein Celaphus_00019025 [Cervus elaphus hippelaphus]|uniref:Uncharacterized protein n=1 Tax=Cervus elaphus hippelaphus TaxID=46360 RepID=A0A212C7C2_CEREH|nr:hypothetical protein Celaphus_00019025 [Cervus elaphus hippelaphus]
MQAVNHSSPLGLGHPPPPTPLRAAELKGREYISATVKTPKQWKMGEPNYEEEEELLHTVLGKTGYTGIDHHWKETFRINRVNPICSMTWGFDGINGVNFNLIETFLLGSCASHRNILYDMRYAISLKKIILDMRTNTIC